MILKEEQIKYKELLGYRYSSKVIAYLNKKGLKNSNQIPFSSAHVRNVMNGKASHDIIENSILKVFKIELKKQEEKQKLLGL